MKRARQFGRLPHVRYRPEVQHCLHCGAALHYSHPVWAKAIQFLHGPEHVTNLGWRCSNPACPFGRTVYRSARAEARQVKGSGYGLDVVVRIGHLRFHEHRTREEIWRELDEQAPVQLSERHVQNLLEVYLALLRASERDPRDRLAATVDAHGGIILALDGLQPEQGNEQLWVVREVLSGAVLGAANLQQASAPFLARLLRPVQAAGLPVLGVVSDAQESIRLAVADVFPGVPHQLCQYHALREAAEPLWEADRHLLVQAKQELRGLRDVEERTRRPTEPEPTDPASGVVLDTVLALRQVVRERGQLPFAFAGLRVMDALAELGATLDRCLRKKGMPGWPGCACWSAGPSSSVGPRPPTCVRPMAGCARSPTAWSPPPPMRPRPRRPGPRCASGWRATWTSWPRH
jgi:hypothetical protein